jgi:hypothetical protein
MPTTQTFEAVSKQIWDKLYQINCSNNIEKKNGLSYLSWAWAYKMVMDEYPQFQYEMLPVVFYGNGTAEVQCKVWIQVEDVKVERTMWLAVMNNRNQAIANPSAVDIANSKMRCLTKAISMLGLGASIYAGEDVPEQVVGKHDDHVDAATGVAPVPPPMPSAVPVDAPPPLVPVNPLPADTAPVVPVAPPPEAIDPDAPVIVDESAASNITDVMIGMARGMHSDSMENLTGFWTTNKATIDVLDEKFPHHYQRLKTVFTEIKQSLTAAPAAVQPPEGAPQ